MIGSTLAHYKIARKPGRDGMGAIDDKQIKNEFLDSRKAQNVIHTFH